MEVTSTVDYKELCAKKITRYGAYGIIVQDSKLLLTQKRAGPYKGLWDLPGGGIEFGETPEVALKREIQEETGLLAKQTELLTVMTNFGEYSNSEGPFHFHHIGIIYRVHNISSLAHVVPEEKMRWITIHEVNSDELTPFANQAWKHIFKK